MFYKYFDNIYKNALYMKKLYMKKTKNLAKIEYKII